VLEILAITLPIFLLISLMVWLIKVAASGADSDWAVLDRRLTPFN